jgi:hypothetical protein
MGPNELVDKIMELLQAEFQTVAESVVNPLQNAVASGLVQADLSDPKMLAKVDVIARDWAENRAAEMVGMIRDNAGVLVPNPDAKWAITDTTREALKRIITDAFSDPSVTMEDIAQAIDDSGIFSADRAAMIASTEVSTAQMQGTISIWQDSGMVDTVDVMLSVENPCDECKEIADAGPYTLDEIGPEFPFHPNCNCSLVPRDIAEVAA